ncbi:MAG: hypothetical protein KY476_21495 [Planctomycetes bacterium]|nr:hypothetical protein [Planctomycetota bacterium]
MLRAAYDKECHARRRSLSEIIHQDSAIGRPVGLIIVAGTVLFTVWLAAQGRALDLFLAASGLFATAFVFALAGGLVRGLHSSSELAVLSHLPVSDLQFARSLWNRAAFDVVLHVGIAFATLYGFYAWWSGFGLVAWLLALALAALQALLFICLSTLVLVSRPRWPYAATTAALLIAALVIVGFSRQPPNAWFRQAATDVLYLLTPSGWISSLLVRGFAGGQPAAGWAIVPVCLLISFLPKARTRLFGMYRVVEFAISPEGHACAKISGPLCCEEDLAATVLTSDSEVVPDRGCRRVDFAALNAALNAAERPLAESEATERVLCASLTGGRPWADEGRIERLVAPWFSTREKALIEFIYGQRIYLTSIVAAGIVAIVVGAIVDAVVGMAGGMPRRGLWMAMGAGFAAILTLAGEMKPFHHRNCGGTLVPHFSVFPVVFRELYRAIMKLCLVRAAWLLGPIAVVAVSVAVPLGVRPWNATLIAVGVVGFFIVLQSLLATTAISQSRLPRIGGKTAYLVLAATGIWMMIASGPILMMLAAAPNLPKWFRGLGFALFAGGTALLSGFHLQLDRICPPDLARSDSGSSVLWSVMQRRERMRRRSEICRRLYGRLWWLRRDLHRWVQQRDL